MKMPLITENQFNYIKLFNIGLLLIIGVGGTILYKTNILKYIEFNSVYKFVLYFISLVSDKKIKGRGFTTVSLFLLL